MTPAAVLFDHKHALVVEALRNHEGSPGKAFAEINARDPALLDGVSAADFMEVLLSRYGLRYDKDSHMQVDGFQGFSMPATKTPEAEAAPEATETAKPIAATATKKAPKIKYVNVPIPFVKDKRLTPLQKTVMIVLETYDWSGNGCYPAYSTLARDLTIDRRTVIRAIAALVRAGFVVVSKRPGGTTNYYKLCHFDTPPVPSSH